MTTDNPPVDAAPRTRWMLFVALGLVALPFVLVMLRIAGREHPATNGDDALIELRVSDVFTHRTPLLGSYQRYGWNQPGPLYFYLLAIPYRLFGQSFTTIQITVALANLTAVCVVILVIRRRFGDIAALWAGAVLAVAVHGMTLRYVIDPWEPSIAGLLLVALVVLGYDAARGNTRSWYGVVLLGSLLAQAYASVALVAVGVAAAAIAGGVVRRARATQQGRARERVVRPLALAAGLTIIAWIPPLLEQLRHDPGNVTLMLRFFRSSHDTLGAKNALRALRLETGLSAHWITNHIPKLPLTTTIDVQRAPIVPWAIVAFAAAAIIAWRRRDTDTAQLIVMSLIAIGLAVISLRSVVLPLFVWIIAPDRAVGVLLWIPIGVAFARWRPNLSRLTAVGSLLLITIASVLSTADAVRVTTGAEAGPAAFDAAAGAIAPRLSSLHSSILIRSDVSGQLLSGPGFGLDETAVALATRGVDVVVDRAAQNRYGRDRATPERAKYELRVMLAASAMPRGYTQLAIVDPMGRDRSQRDALSASLTRLCVQTNRSPAPQHDDKRTLDWLSSCTRADRRAKAITTQLGERYGDFPRMSLRLGPVQS